MNVGLSASCGKSTVGKSSMVAYIRVHVLSRILVSKQTNHKISTYGLAVINNYNNRYFISLIIVQIRNVLPL